MVAICLQVVVVGKERGKENKLLGPSWRDWMFI